MSQQGLRQQSVRDITGTTLTYEGDWHALFDQAEIPAGTFNERMLAYMNEALQAAHTNINDALAAAAALAGASNWSSAGDLSSVLTTLSITYSAISFDVADQPYTLTGAEVPVLADSADDGTGVFELTPALSDGYYTLGSVTGLTFTLNDGVTDSISTFEGTLANLNAALDGLVIDGITTAGTFTFEIPFSSSTSGDQLSVIISMTVTHNDVEYAAYYGASDNYATYDGVYRTDGAP